MKEKEESKKPFFVHTMVESDNGGYVTSDYADAKDSLSDKDWTEIGQEMTPY